MSDENEFESVASGAAEFYPQQCSLLRKNGHVVIKGKPCKIVEMSTSKTGKHGHAKVHLVGTDIFTQKKYEDICPSTHNMQVPNVTRKDYQVLSIDEEGYFCLMDDNGETIEDLKREDCCSHTYNEVVELLKKCDNDGSSPMATVQAAMGSKAVISMKVNTK